MNGKFLILIVVFVVGASAMILKATTSGAAPVMMPSELIKAGREVPRVRVAGRVAAGDLTYEISPKALLKFKVEDPKHPENGAVPVIYEGVRPDMFAEGRDVILDGAFSNGTIVASSLQTQCPSKYEAPDPNKPYQEQPANAPMTNTQTTAPKAE